MAARNDGLTLHDLLITEAVKDLEAHTPLRDDAALAGAVAAGGDRSARVLWRARLPAGGQATPMSYRSAASGRQFVVVVAGGHGSLGTKLGDNVIAYALPK